MRGWGIGASIVWAIVVAAYAIGYVTTLKPTGGEMMLALAGFLAVGLVPVVLIWWNGRLGRALAERNDDAEALRAELTALTEQVEGLTARLAEAEARLDEVPTIEVPQDKPPALIAPEPVPLPEPEKEAPEPKPEPLPQPEPEPEPEPELPVEPPEDLDQPALPLEGGSDGGELSLSDAIQALNFPQDAQDQAGFAVLRRALQRHDLAKLLQASEDCLNLLAHQGIYTDDLMPAPASAPEWRQFAKGGAARAELMPMTGITDTKALEKVQAQMRADPIFRDTALYFQRRFDRMLQDAAPDATDEEVLRLVDTRSGRAFVLLVQVGGLSNT